MTTSRWHVHERRDGSKPRMCRENRRHAHLSGFNTYGESTARTGTFTAVGVGSQYSCALRTDGTLICWGLSSAGSAIPPSGTFVGLTVNGYHGSDPHCLQRRPAAVRRQMPPAPLPCLRRQGEIEFLPHGVLRHHKTAHSAQNGQSLRHCASCAQRRVWTWFALAPFSGWRPDCARRARAAPATSQLRDLQCAFLASAGCCLHPERTTVRRERHSLGYLASGQARDALLAIAAPQDERGRDWNEHFTT
jgi:hypothetical protein